MMKSFLSLALRLATVVAARRCKISVEGSLYNTVTAKRLTIANGLTYRGCTTLAVEEHVEPPRATTCTGCGSLLQYLDDAEQGYVPDVDRDSATILCKRCFNIKHYNKSIKVNLPPDEYKQHLSHLRDKTSLLLCIIDVIDFPSSLFPGLSELVNPASVMFVVANKMDLLPSTDSRYLRALETYILSEAKKAGLVNVSKVIFTSAKRNIGIEELTQHIVLTSRNDDVYLLGCTNVGKSSLFHKLLVALCGIKPGAPQDNQTTPTLDPLISQVPGTTLGLIKGPIMKRNERTNLMSRAHKAGLVASPKQLSFPKELVDAWSSDPIELNASSWLYDTPGAMSNAQVIHHLTNKELTLFLPKGPLKPRTIIVKPQQSLFIGGLTRLDYVEGSDSIYFTVFTTTGTLPLHVSAIRKADGVYERNKGKPLLYLPLSDEDRDPPYPPLVPHTVSVIGVSWEYSVVDVMLSTVGWVAVTAGKNVDATLTAHLPADCQVFVRHPSLYDKAIKEKGRRSNNPSKRAFYHGKAKYKKKALTT